MADAVNAFTVYSSLELQINEFVQQLNRASQILDSTLQNMSNAVSSLNIQPIEVNTEANINAVQDIENAVSGVNAPPVNILTEADTSAVWDIESAVSDMVVSPVLVDTEPNLNAVNEIESAVSSINVSPIVVQTESNISGISEIENAISSMNISTITVPTETEPLEQVTVPPPDDRSFIQKIKDSFNNLKNIINSVPSNIAGKFKEIGTNIVNSFKSFPANVATKFSEMKTTAVDKIKALPTNVAEVITSIPSKIGSGLKTIGTNISNTFKSGVENAKNALKELPEKASKALKETGEKLKSIAETVAKSATVAISAVSAGIVAFGKSAVETGANFDKSMSQVAATMGKSVDEVADLRAFAQEMGRTTAFSATDSADALNYMALAGYDAETSMAMLPNVLNLASAGGMELALASDMITDSQSALGLSLDETTLLVDKMAKASSKSNTSVSQLGDAILTVGGTAKKLKGGTTELATVLGILADNGIKGSEGGTALRNIMNSLISPTEDAMAMLDQMGTALYDADGNMRSLNDVFIDLRNGMSGLATQAEKDQVLTTIFNARDLKSAEALITNVGDRFNELSTEIDNCSGAADAMAKTQLDNLAGDVTLFQSALEGAKIAVSDQLTPALRDFVQLGTDGLSSVTEAFSTGVKEGGVEKGFDNAVKALQPIIEQLIEKVVNILPKVVSVAVKLISVLGQSIIKNIPKLANSAIQLLKGLSENIAKNAPIAIKGFSDMLNKVANWIKKNGKTLISSGMEMIKSIAKGISDNLPDMIGSITEIVTFIATEISENLDDLLDSGLYIIDAIRQGILDNLPNMINSAKKIISFLTEMIRTNLPLILDSALDIISAVGQGIVENLPLLINSALEIIKSLAKYLGESLPEIIPSVIDVVLQIVETLTDPKTLSALVDSALAIIIGLADGLINSLPVLLERLPQIVQNIVDVIVDNVPKLLDAAIEIIAKLGEYLIDPENLVAILDAGLEIIVALIDGAGRVLWKLGKMAEDMIQAIADTLGLGEYREWGMDMIENFMQGAREKFDEWNDFWEDVGIAVYDLLHHSKPEKGPLKDDDKWGGDLMDNLINGVKSKEKNFSETIKNIAKNIFEIFKEPINNAWQWGTDMVQNFLNGLKEKAHDLWDGVKSIAQGVKDFLGFSEPDKGPLSNFHTFAPDMIALFTKGIKDNKKSIFGEINDIATSIKDTFNKPISVNTDVHAKETFSGFDMPDISGVDFMNNLINGIKFKENSLLDTLNNVAESIRNTFEKPISVNADITTDENFNWLKLPDISGVDFMNNLINGIKSKENSLLDTLNNVAESIRNTFKKPISVNTDITTDENFNWLKLPDISGVDFMNNLINGIKSKENSLSDTLNNVAESIRNTFEKPISVNTDITIDENFKRLNIPDISTVAENIYTVKSDNAQSYQTEKESTVTVESLNIYVEGTNLNSEYEIEKFTDMLANRLNARAIRKSRGTGGVIL